MRTLITRSITIVIVLGLVLGIGASSATAAAPADVEKAVFVHYRTAPPAPDGARKGGPKACPDPATCPDYAWRGQHWAGPVTYDLNTTGSGSSKASSAVTAAFDAWTARITGSLTITRSSNTTDCDTAGTDLDTRNQICWRDLSNSNVIAVTYVWYYRSTKQIVQADVIFNSGVGFAWSYDDLGACATYDDCNGGGGADAYDIRNIATHEFGHFLAFLGDLYGGRDSELTMYGYGSTAEVKKDSLGKGDCLGITAAYGGTCP